MSIDWGDGDYGRTASQLAPVAEIVADAIAARMGMSVLDVACGTGNLALVCARRGARVTGVDPSARLLGCARDRAASEGLDLDLREGAAAGLPVVASSFDAVASVFGVIFAPDPPAAAQEMVLAARSGGVVALTSWIAAGPVDRVARLLMGALPEPPPPVGDWDDPGWLTALLDAAGGRDIAVERHALTIRAPSPDAWLADLEEHHPVWRWVQRQADAREWERVHAESLDVLRAANEDPAGFAVTSGYLLLHCRR